MTSINNEIKIISWNYIYFFHSFSCWLFVVVNSNKIFLPLWSIPRSIFIVTKIIIQKVNPLKWLSSLCAERVKIVQRPPVVECHSFNGWRERGREKKWTNNDIKPQTLWQPWIYFMSVVICGCAHSKELFYLQVNGKWFFRSSNLSPCCFRWACAAGVAVSVAVCMWWINHYHLPCRMSNFDKPSTKYSVLYIFNYSKMHTFAKCHVLM